MNAWLNRIANLILLTLGLESLCALISESFSLSLPSETYSWLAVLCLLLWLTFGFRLGVLAGMPLSAAVLWYLYRYRSTDLMGQLRTLLDHVSAAYYGQFTGNAVSVNSSGVTESPMAALLLILFVLGAFLSAALVSGSFRVSLSMLGTMPLFAVCIAVNGKPSVLPALGVFLFWAGLQFGGDSFRLTDGAGKAFAVGVIPCFAVLALLLLLYRPDTYVPDEKDFSLSQRFDALGNAVSRWMDGEGSIAQEIAESVGMDAPRERRAPSGWDRSGEELDLTVPFDTAALEKTAFEVSFDTAGSMYLRGRSYGDYTGTGWSTAIENSRGSALSYTARALSAASMGTVANFTLQSPAVYDILYLPYFTVSASGGDVSVPAEGRSSYGGALYLSGADAASLSARASVPGELQEEERRYREYVHTYYTRLPDAAREAMEKICSDAGIVTGQQNLLATVADYVRRVGVYDIYCDAWPTDDYAAWFFTQQASGYCIHYATAAVVMYRSLGIPARVCEGYLVNSLIPNSTVVVKGADAHAWAEVYLDGVGWIPVEVTASAADDPNMNTEGSAEPTPDAGDAGQPETETPSTTGTPEENGGEDGQGTQPDQGASESEGTAGAVLKLLLALLLLAGLFFGRYAVLRAVLKKRLQNPDCKRTAVNLYRQADRVLRYGGEMPDILRETAEKARFSQHEISPEELQACRDALQKLTQTVFESLSAKRRFFFRFWTGNL